MRLKNNRLQVLGVAGEAERAQNKTGILILKKAKEEPQLLLCRRAVKSMQLPGCISQGGAFPRGAKKQQLVCPWLCALPRRAGCGAALTGAMAAASRLCGWLDSRQVAWPRCALPTAPQTPQAPRLTPGAEQEWQQPGLLESNPPEDLSPGFARCRQPACKC